MLRIVMFSFWGRQPNIELQLPFIRRILADNPQAEFHAWNLARNREDNWFIRSVAGERIRVRHDFYKLRRQGFAEVYRYYANNPNLYGDCVFVKLDDDVVFLQTDRFADFIAAVQNNPGAVVSANVINNGACARANPELFRRFTVSAKPLLDWHKHVRFAELAHEYFFENSRDLLAQPVDVVPTQDWLSINCVGMDHPALVTMTAGLGNTPPPHIAGRAFSGADLLGDEGACNMMDRVIVKGFTAAHLTFGPQLPTFTQLEGWRHDYAETGAEYLASARQRQMIG